MHFLRFIIPVLISFSLFSCSEKDSSALSVAVAQEPVVLDLMVNSSVSGRNIADGNVYERLIALSDGNLVPQLAESFELGDSGKTLTIKIREGVLFHDGSELDAEDAVLSMNRWLSYYASAERLVGDSRFTASGDCISIKADSSLVLLPFMIASSPLAAVIVPAEEILSLDDGEILQSVAGTGPYRMKEWRYGDSIELERWDEYWGEMPEIEHITYSFVPDSVTRRLGLESGQFDFIDTVLSDDIPQLSKMDGITLHQGDENGSIVLVFNKKAGVSADADFRKAVSLFIDRDELMKACYGDYGYSLHSDYMEADSLWSVDDSSDPFGTENEEKGLEYLRASSYDNEPVRILSSNLTNLDKIAIALSSELEEEGIETEIIILDWAAFIEKRNDPEFWDIYVSATSSTILPLEKNYLTATSPGGFDNPESETLLKAVAETESVEEAISIWQDCQKSLWNYIPVIVPGHYSTVYASVSTLENIDFTNGFNFRKAAVK